MDVRAVQCGLRLTTTIANEEDPSGEWIESEMASTTRPTLLTRRHQWGVFGFTPEAHILVIACLSHSMILLNLLFLM